jgi:sugar-specific transcriptional regulator TrmB
VIIIKLFCLNVKFNNIFYILKTYFKSYFCIYFKSVNLFDIYLFKDYTKDMDDIKNLQKLGLTDKEAHVYKGSLELGKFSVIQIARKTNLKRPTCYLILDSLLQKGLVSIIPQSKKLLYKAESPEVLIEQAERNIILAKKVVPFLDSLQQKNVAMPEIKFYSGQEGIRNIYEDLFKSKVKSYKYIGATEDVLNMAGADFIKDHVYRRIEKKIKVIGIRIKEKEVEEKVFAGEKDYLRDIRYAPTGFSIPGILFIYAKKIAFVSSEQGNFGFVIDGNDFYKTIDMFFDTIWSLSSE